MGNILAPLVLSVGLTGSFYDDTTEPRAVSDDDLVPKIGYAMRLGWEDFPVYGVASFEAMDNTILGQGIGAIDALSLGIGAKKRWEDFSFFLETGVTLIDLAASEVVQDEIVYTHLVGNHNVEGATVPVNPRDYENSYDLDNGVFFRVGVGYYLTDHLSVTAAYRALYVDEEMAIWDPERRYNGDGGYWREDDRKDLSSIEVGINWEF
jgi:hypothetical protein